MKNTHRAGTDIVSAPEARQCKSCQRVFGSELHLKYHAKRIHRSDRAPYVCRGCNKPFRRIHELQRHSLQTLTCPANEGSGRSLSFWQAVNCCLLCGAGGFRTLAALRRHLSGRRHLNDIAYTCQHCSAGFLMVDELNLHRVAVHGEQYNGGAAVRRKRHRSESTLFVPAQDDDDYGDDERIDEDAIADSRSQSHFSVVAGAAGLKLVLKKVTPAAAAARPEMAASLAIVEGTCDEKQQNRVVDSTEASDCEYEPASHTTADSGKGLSDQSDESDSDACAAAAADMPAPPSSAVAEPPSPLASAIGDNRPRACASASGALLPPALPQPTTESTRPPLRLSIVIGRDPTQTTAAAMRASSSSGSVIAGGRSPAAATVGRFDLAAGAQQESASSTAPSSEPCLIKKPRLHLPGGAVCCPGSPASSACSSGTQPPAFGAEFGAFANGSSLLRAPTLVPSSPSAAAAGPSASPRPQQPAFALSHRPHVPTFSFLRPHEAFGIKAPSLLPPPPGATATAAAAAAAVARQSDLFASTGLPSDVLGRMAGSSLLGRRLGTVGCGTGSAVLAGAAPPAARLVPLSPLALPAQPASSPAVQARLASAAAAATVAAAAAAAAVAASPSHDAGRFLLPPPSPARWSIHSGRQLASPAYSPVGESQSRQSASAYVERSSPVDGRTFAAGESPADVQLRLSSTALPPPPAFALCAMRSPSPSIDRDHSTTRNVLDGRFLPAATAATTAQSIVDHRLEQPEQQHSAARASSTSTLLHSDEIAVAMDRGCRSARPQPPAEADRLGVADATPQLPSVAPQLPSVAAAAGFSSPPPSSAAVSAPARRTRSGSQGSLDSRDSGLDYSPVGDLSHHSTERQPIADGCGTPCDRIAATACQQQCTTTQPPPSTSVDSKCRLGPHMGDESPVTSATCLVAAAILTVNPPGSAIPGPTAASVVNSATSLSRDVSDVVEKAAAESAATIGEATTSDEAVERATAVCHPISGLAPLSPRVPLIRCVADLDVPSLAVSVPLALLLRADTSIASRGNESGASCDPSRRPCTGAVAVTTAGAASGKRPGQERSHRSSCIVSEQFRRKRTSQSEAIGGVCATTLDSFLLEEDDDNDDHLDEQDVSGSCSDDDSSSNSSSCSDEMDLVSRQPAELLFELHRDGCARTSSAATAVGRCRFVEDSLYLAHVRAKTCAMLLSLFPHIRVGGTFSPHTCDVEDLVETITDVLARGGGRGSNSSESATSAIGSSDVGIETPSLCSRPRLHCVSSQPSERRELGLRLCAVARQEVRRLQRGVCSLVRLALPGLSWDELQADGICTFDELLDAIVGAN